MKKKTRRQMLISGAVIVPTVISAGVTAKGFTAPSIVTFCTSELQVDPSSNGMNKHKGNGNHYGNNKPDLNPVDHKNQYDGVDGFVGGPHDKPHGKK